MLVLLESKLKVEYVKLNTNVISPQQLNSEVLKIMDQNVLLCVTLNYTFD